MVKITLKIDGMACGMCESHINDAIRRAFKVKKVTSSHSMGVTKIISENPITREEIEAAMKDTGYKVFDVRTEPYEKKGFSLFRR